VVFSFNPAPMQYALNYEQLKRKFSFIVIVAAGKEPEYVLQAGMMLRKNKKDLSSGLILFNMMSIFCAQIQGLIKRRGLECHLRRFYV
jgi:hypothetical protein